MPENRLWTSLFSFLILRFFWLKFILGLLMVNILPFMMPERDVIYLYDTLYYLA